MPLVPGKVPALCGCNHRAPVSIWWGFYSFVSGLEVLAEALMSLIQSVNLAPIPSLPDAIEPEKCLAGAPMTGTRPALENEAKGFYTGVWASSVGKWAISFTENEFCYLLEGHVRLTADDGTVSEFRAGEAFTIASGFKGSWETIEPVRKIYAISL
jgi:uncharacterized protein